MCSGEKVGIGRPISAAIEGYQCQSSAVAKTPLCEQLALGQGLLCCGEGQKHFCRGRKMKEVTDCVNFLFLEGKLRASPNVTPQASNGMVGLTHVVLLGNVVMNLRAG